MKLQKTICYKISKLYHYQSDLGNPNSATNARITFHLCSYSKFMSPIILHFTKIKPLKITKKCFFVSTKLLLWFLQYSNFRKKYLFELTDQKWPGDGPLKKKDFWRNLAISKVVPGTFWDWAKTKKEFSDIPLHNILFPKSFVNALAIFLDTYQGQSKHSRLVLQKTFLKKVYGPFLWMGFNCLKATEPLQGDTAIYFLPLILLISSVSAGWKVELTLQPLSDFEPGTHELRIQCLNR